MVATTTKAITGIRLTRKILVRIDLRILSLAVIGWPETSPAGGWRVVVAFRKSNYPCEIILKLLILQAKMNFGKCSQRFHLFFSEFSVYFPIGIFMGL